METLVECEHVSISFKGNEALSDLSFTLMQGEIFGFLGPSGAGKTTTIKLLTKQLMKDHGSIKIFHEDIEDIKASSLYQQISVLSDNSGFYEKMSVQDNLLLFSNLSKISKDRVSELLHETGLYDHRKKKAATLSKGMKQRLLFTRAILTNPKILFLDEPTSSLDPSTSLVVHKMIKELNKKGTTIFLTTHNMLEADKLCDRVAFLNHGKIVELGNPDELKLKYAENKVKILTDQKEEIIVNKNREALIQELQALDSNLLRIHSVEPSLESIFLTITGREL